jgi:hypothetical protein
VKRGSREIRIGEVNLQKIDRKKKNNASVRIRKRR